VVARLRCRYFHARVCGCVACDTPRRARVATGTHLPLPFAMPFLFAAAHAAHTAALHTRAALPLPAHLFGFAVIPRNTRVTGFVTALHTVVALPAPRCLPRFFVHATRHTARLPVVAALVLCRARLRAYATRMHAAAVCAFIYARTWFAFRHVLHGLHVYTAAHHRCCTFAFSHAFAHGLHVLRLPALRFRVFFFFLPRHLFTRTGCGSRSLT